MLTLPKKYQKLFRVNERKLLIVGLLILIIGLTGSLIRLTHPKKLPDTSLRIDTSHATPVATESTVSLSMPQLGVTAPIILNVSGDDAATYLKTLEYGVAHYKGSALPGKAGNVFLFGHCEYDANNPGKYKEVFKQLNFLGESQRIYITDGDKKYVYKILSKKEVLAKDMSVANQNTFGKHMLTLMTNWPPGSSEKRYVIKAQQIEP
jgi:LPXTG-site transpeptidase (sortase) family protein